jgi:hypothetical protein
MDLALWPASTRACAALPNAVAAAEPDSFRTADFAALQRAKMRGPSSSAVAEESDGVERLPPLLPPRRRKSAMGTAHVGAHPTTWNPSPE